MAGFHCMLFDEQLFETARVVEEEVNNLSLSSHKPRKTILIRQCGIGSPKN